MNYITVKAMPSASLQGVDVITFDADNIIDIETKSNDFGTLYLKITFYDNTIVSCLESVSSFIEKLHKAYGIKSEVKN